jgi:uncharacterized protein (TIGR03083 family)
VTVDTMSYAAKDLVLDTISRERANFFGMVEKPENWNVQTRCTEWEVRDVVGHMIDVTEGYLNAWEIARQGGSREPKGLLVMADSLNDAAQSFRSLSQEEAVGRLRKGSDTLMGIFEGLSEQDWGGYLVPHPYMGPLPTFFYAAFQVIDYGVHNWDIRYGLGDVLGKMDERTAGVLVPYMFVLFGATVDAPSAAGQDFTYGIDVSGEFGGKWHVTVSDGKFEQQADSGDFAGCQALFRFDPSDFILSAYQRFPGGCASGDPDVIERARGLFFRI